MKNKKTNSRRRNFFAASLAAMMLTLTCGTAYADSNVDVPVSVSETVELTDIGGYACYQRDGNYWTMLDGEECLVIDLSTLAGTLSEPASATSSITPPPYWNNNEFVYLSDYDGYSGEVDLSKGDFYSPVFEVSPELADCRIDFKTDHIKPNKYKIKIWTHHMAPVNEWVPYTTEHNFNLVARSMVLLTGSESKVSDAFGFKIYADSLGRDDFSYKVMPITVNL